MPPSITAAAFAQVGVCSVQRWCHLPYFHVAFDSPLSGGGATHRMPLPFLGMRGVLGRMRIGSLTLPIILIEYGADHSRLSAIVIQRVELSESMIPDSGMPTKAAAARGQPSIFTVGSSLLFLESGLWNFCMQTHKLPPPRPLNVDYSPPRHSSAKPPNNKTPFCHQRGGRGGRWNHRETGERGRRKKLIIKTTLLLLIVVDSSRRRYSLRGLRGRWRLCTLSVTVKSSTHGTTEEAAKAGESRKRRISSCCGGCGGGGGGGGRVPQILICRSAADSLLNLQAGLSVLL